MRDINCELEPSSKRRKRFRFFRSWFQKAPKRSIPDGQRVYAVGDIHGCIKALEELTKRIVHDSQDGPETQIIVYLGDYVDRGSDSRGVVNHILNTLPKFEVRCLRGNHDQILLDFLKDPSIYPAWENIGAYETFLSYGVEPPNGLDEREFAKARDHLVKALSEEHLNFFEDLLHSTEIGDYYFAHAGVRPGVPLENQRPEDLLWIREAFLSSKDDFGKIVVHGHTPRTKPVVRRNRIGIDTGAYLSGHLTAAVLEGGTCRFLQTET